MLESRRMLSYWHGSSFLNLLTRVRLDREDPLSIHYLGNVVGWAFGTLRLGQFASPFPRPVGLLSLLEIENSTDSLTYHYPKKNTSIDII